MTSSELSLNSGLPHPPAPPPFTAQANREKPVIISLIRNIVIRRHYKSSLVMPLWPGNAREQPHTQSTTAPSHPSFPHPLPRLLMPSAADDDVTAADTHLAPISRELPSFSSSRKWSLCETFPANFSILRSSATGGRPTSDTGTARHGTARHGTARHDTTRHDTIRNHTARHGTARHTSGSAKGQHAARPKWSAVPPESCGQKFARHSYRTDLVCQRKLISGRSVMHVGGASLPARSEAPVHIRFAGFF